MKNTLNLMGPKDYMIKAARMGDSEFEWILNVKAAACKVLFV